MYFSTGADNGHGRKRTTKVSPETNPTSVAIFVGIGVRFRLEQVFELNWNQCSISVGTCNYRAVRTLDRSLLDSLASCRWLREHRNVILVGPTGIGKTFLSSALTLKACQEGFAARYFRTPRLLHELEIGRAGGTHKHQLASLARIDLVVLDDWTLVFTKKYVPRSLLAVLGCQPAMLRILTRQVIKPKELILGTLLSLHQRYCSINKNIKTQAQLAKCSGL